MSDLPDEILTDIAKQDYDRYLDGYSLEDLTEQYAFLRKQYDIKRAIKETIQEIDPEGLLDDNFQDMK